MLSCDCSSISRPCSVRRISVISDLDVWRISVLAATSLFRASVWNRHSHRHNQCIAHVPSHNRLSRQWEISGRVWVQSYLCLEPGFKFFVVLGGHILVLLADLSHDGGQVLLWWRVHLHVDLSTHLASHGCQFLLKKTHSLRDGQSFFSLHIRDSILIAKQLTVLEWPPTSSWFFLRKISSSLRPSICISRSDLASVSSSNSLLRPAISASTDWRMASSFSYLWGSKRSDFCTPSSYCFRLTLQFNSLCVSHSSWYLLGSEVICSQFGIVNGQIDASIDTGGVLDLCDDTRFHLT